MIKEKNFAVWRSQKQSQTADDIMLAGMKVEKLIFPLHRNTTPSEAFQ